MKIRAGFVSNSSSSSFVMASTLKGDALREKLEKVFGLNYDLSGKPYPIKAFDLNIGKHIYKTLDDGISTKEEYLKEIYSTEEKARQSEDYSKNLDFIENGFTIYMGGFSDEGYGDLDQFLCKSEISYEDSELYIYQEGGY